MLDSYCIKIPAKINLFLKIFNKRQDEYHNILSGITFINLFDEISVKKSHSTKIKYSGKFKPKNNTYKDCIIKKTLKFLDLNKNYNFEINIKKNIPTLSGLGSASSNATGLIKCLENLNVYKIHKDYKFYVRLGADIPVFLFGKNALVSGIGEKINNLNIEKYYFLLVRPNINFSTSVMYNSLQLSNKEQADYKFTKKKLNLKLFTNDFEKIVLKKSKKINELINFLSNTDKCLFARMTGSGSCCYAVYKKKEYAYSAKLIVKKKYPNYWSNLNENNVKY